MIFLQLQKEPLQKDKADAEDPAPPVPLKREVDNKGRGRKARATAGTVTHAGPVAWDVVLANTAFLFALVLVDPDKPDGDEPIPKDEDDAADDHNLAGDNADDDDEEAADRARRLATMISTRTRILKCPLPARSWPRMPKSCRCPSTPCHLGGNRSNAPRWAAHWN